VLDAGVHVVAEAAHLVGVHGMVLSSAAGAVGAATNTASAKVAAGANRAFIGAPSVACVPGGGILPDAGEVRA
jgi:hypothetical protein